MASEWRNDAKGNVHAEYAEFHSQSASAMSPSEQQRMAKMPIDKDQE